MKFAKLVAIFLVLIVFCNMPLLSQQIVAHRGASFLAPENTVAAVKLGYALGADAVEVDVHLSKDKKIMVNHDKDTRRTAKGKNLSIQATEAQELRKLDVGSWKDAQYKGERMPFLSEVLAVVPEDKLLVIEIKSDEEMLPYLQEEIDKGALQDQLILISFNKDLIVQAKKLMPDLPAYWLLHNYKAYSLEEAIQIALDHNLSGLDVNYKLVTAEFMQKMNDAGLDVYAYTVNDEKAARKLRKLAIKGITTDRPEWLRKRLEE